MEKRFANENFSPEYQSMADRMNLDEAEIPSWTVPGPASSSGADFLCNERPGLLQQFARCIYGAVPSRCEGLDFDVIEECPAVFGGLATRREIVIRCSQRGKVRFLNLLLYLPNARTGKVPVFFGLNFKGNHSSSTDPGVRFTITRRYPMLQNTIRKADNRAGIEEHGSDASRWCFETVLRRGYAAATVCYYDLYPDHPMGFNDSILPLFFDEKLFLSSERPCGAISAWAWGISRAVDCLEAQPEIDARRIAVHGHSRLGKTALWAGANDERIALTISCCSGTLGAKLSHRYFGEDFAWIDLWNPHWTIPVFKRYVQHDAEIPVDQNQLIGCIAPRLAYITSATADEYADPHGEFLSGNKASPFYRLFGSEGIGTDRMPAPGIALKGDIGYYLRAGEHNICPENWSALLDYADFHWKKD